MALAFRAAATGNAGGSALVTINVPAGTANGDIMIAVIVTSGTAVANVPTGWTLLDSEATGPSARTYVRVALGEPANYTWTFTAGTAVSGVIASYSGGDGTTPVNAHSAMHRTAGTTTVTGDTITTTVADTLVIFAGGVGQAATFTGPTSFTQRATASGNGIAALIADVAQPVAGATGTVTATSSISGNTQGTLIAIAPGAGGGAAADTVVIHQ